MTERDQADAPYYQYDEFIGEAPLHGRPTGIHLRLHTAQERYYRPQEIFLLKRAPGTATYVHAKPYILVPDIRVSVALAPSPEPEGPIGRVVGAELRNFRRREIGQAQAWHYPKDRALLIWECFLNAPYQTGVDPSADPLHVFLWQAFERSLLRRLPATDRLVTTWEDSYERESWQAFLERQGYRPYGPSAPVAFVKAVGGEP